MWEIYVIVQYIYRVAVYLHTRFFITLKTISRLIKLINSLLNSHTTNACLQIPVNITYKSSSAIIFNNLTVASAASLLLQMVKLRFIFSIGVLLVSLYNYLSLLCNNDDWTPMTSQILCSLEIFKNSYLLEIHKHERKNICLEFV